MTLAFGVCSSLASGPRSFAGRGQAHGLHGRWEGAMDWTSTPPTLLTETNDIVIALEHIVSTVAHAELVLQCMR